MAFMPMLTNYCETIDRAARQLDGGEGLGMAISYIHSLGRFGRTILRCLIWLNYRRDAGNFYKYREPLNWYHDFVKFVADVKPKDEGDESAD